MTTTRRRAVRALPLTALSYSRILGAQDRIRIAGLGTGGRCRFLLNLARERNTQIVALADVYEPHLAAARQLAPDAQGYVDYREVLARTDVDAVFIGSPDHWHVPMTLDAIRAGKDVYVEKPVSHNIAEGEELLRQWAASNRVVQVGYQQRSWDHFRQGAEIVASGRLGRIPLVLASWYQAYVRTRRNMPPIETSRLDWRRFQGAAPAQPLELDRFRNWRWYWAFGGGHLTDLYSHYGDVIHWYLGIDTPSRAVALGNRSLFPQYECPDTLTAVYDYPGQITVTYSGTLAGSLDAGNILFRGTEAMLKINRDGLAVYPEGVVPAEKTHYPDPIIQIRSPHDGSLDHVVNFLNCVRSRKKPNASPDTAVPTARAAHLGNLAYRRGAPVTFPL